MQRIGVVKAAVSVPFAGAVAIAIGFAGCTDVGDLGTMVGSDGAAGTLEDVSALDTSAVSEGAQDNEGAASTEGGPNEASAGAVTPGDDGAASGSDGAEDDAGAGVETGTAEAGPDEAAPGTSTPEAGPVDAGLETSTPEAGPADAGPETSTPEAGPTDAGPAASTSEAGPADAGLETSTHEAGPADAGPDASGGGDSGGPGCDPTNPLTTTNTCLAAQNKPGDPPSTQCEECGQTSGCYDPTMMGGTCETLSSNPLTHLSGALPDGKTCPAVLGPEPVSERQVCLQTLQDIFSSKCAVSLQETPCLCGTADPMPCLAGSTTPNGVVYDEYACDFDSASGSTINSEFTTPSFGAGMANQLLQCLAGFGCDCF